MLLSPLCSIPNISQNKETMLSSSSSSSPPPHLLRLLFLSLVLCSFHVSFASSSQSVGLGYRLVSIQEAPNGGLIGHLQVKGTTSTYGPDIPHLQLYVKLETPDRLRVHITDAAKQRWEVPYNLLPREQPPLLKNTIGGASTPPTTQEYVGPNLIFSCTSDPFGFAIKRRSDGEVLFNSTSNKDDPFGDLVFKDQYLEISTRLPKSASLYGLGENTQPGGIKLQPNDPYTLYTTDISAINLNIDLYGSHPVYMDLRNKGGVGSAHGVLLLNSNGMDVVYRGGSLTYKAIGGVFDFYFFGGTRPLDVVNQYTSFVGRPAPMPYWALGFHQCRWGYPNISYVEGVVENYKKARIPLDVIWNDDDHMDAAKDFTLDPINYPHDKVVAFLDKIHSRGMKYIVLIDPGINVNSTYATYNRAMSSDVFIKYEGEPFLAQVWPGPVYFPDFLNPKTVQWWVDEIQRFHKLVPVDGLWIDMNEVSNFCTGKCEMPKGNLCPDPKSKEPWLCCLSCTNITKTRWDEPPYKINASGIQAPIGYKTIATSAVHYNGVLEYDAHSLFGFSQTIATHKALLGLEGKRPFILTRSTYVGSGAYAAHWTGDNKGTWEDLRYSISTILNFGIFGIPMVGSDICGFYPAPTEELCNRWIELGAFYPFSRDHSNFASPRQELYVWDSVATSARNALGLRYRLLPYLYTLNYDAHVTGAPIARPLFFTFPNMERVYNMSTQFLLGERVMVSPVLTQGVTSVKALFPKGTWYNLFDMTKAVRVMEGDGQYVVLDAPLNEINVHVCEGAILPMQRGGYTSAEARKTPFTLVVAFPMGASEAEARGSVFVDEDERPVMRVEDGYATRVEFYAKVSAKTVTVMSEVEAGKYSLEEGMVIEKVRVLGLEGSVAGEVVIEVDGMPYSGDVSSVHVSGGSSSTSLERLEGGGKMKAVVVEVAGLNIPLGKKFVLSWKLGVTN